MGKIKPKIIWRSQIFEDMIFTDQMLAVYKTAYPFVDMFQPELLKALSLSEILKKAKGYNDKESQVTNNPTEPIPNTGNENGVG